PAGFVQYLAARHAQTPVVAGHGRQALGQEVGDRRPWAGAAAGGGQGHATGRDTVADGDQQVLGWAGQGRAGRRAVKKAGILGSLPKNASLSMSSTPASPPATAGHRSLI